MVEKDYLLVLAGNTQVNLIGLKEIFEELKNQRHVPESVLKERLVEKAAQRNYIPESVKDGYGKTLLREFKKFIGEKVVEEKSEFLEVILLGAGCFSCNQLEKEIFAVLSETGLKAAFSYITDPIIIAQYGVLALPALIINGTLKSKGTIPSKLMTKKWLEKERR